MDDEQLVAVADTGGVINVVAFSSYVRQDPPEKLAAVQKIEEDLGWEFVARIA